jgi:hypothetical protein
LSHLELTVFSRLGDDSILQVSIKIVIVNHRPMLTLVAKHQERNSGLSVVAAHQEFFGTLSSTPHYPSLRSKRQNRPHFSGNSDADLCRVEAKVTKICYRKSPRLRRSAFAES